MSPRKTPCNKQADSGVDSALYTTLLESGAPLLLVDGRQHNSPEHAGIAEVEHMAAAAAKRGVRVVVTGYGSSAEQPQGVQHCTLAVPGQRWELSGTSATLVA